jgi:hypothetical protein
VLETRNTAAELAAGATPVIVLPFTLTVFLIPKYTLVWELRTTPVQVIVAPPV